MTLGGTVRSIVQQETDLLAQLLEVLKREQGALSQGQIDGEQLQANAQAKLPIYQQIEALENQRIASLTAQQLTDSPQTMQRIAQQQGCLSAWLQMRSLAQRVKQLNELNGELINHRLRHNQQMLNMLRESSAKFAPTYSEKGDQTAQVRRLNSSA